MCVDHTAVIFAYMMDLGFMEDIHQKKVLVPTFVTYYDAFAATKTSVEKCLVTVEGMM